ncbi:UNVERIFIED_CONTAM: hypothetical protein GTU68_031231 [Idotea baltica]|nr:hypothetical protein [Idotea baltica]
MMDCKKALVEAEGDFDKAVEFLRKAGQKVAAKRADNTTAEGVILVDVSDSGKSAKILAFACETEPVSKVEDFTTLGRDVAMQIVAMKPVGLDKDNVDPTIVEKEIEIGKDQARQEGKPEAMLEKIALGKLNKFYKENTLLNQAFVKDPSMNITQLLEKTQKGLKITSFVHVVIG